MTDLHECAEKLRTLLPAPSDAAVPPPAVAEGGAGNPYIDVQRILAEAEEAPDTKERIARWFARYIRVPVELR